jgi:hypothetical protein
MSRDGSFKKSTIKTCYFGVQKVITANRAHVLSGPKNLAVPGGFRDHPAFYHGKIGGNDGKSIYQ